MPIRFDRSASLVLAAAFAAGAGAPSVALAAPAASIDAAASPLATGRPMPVDIGHPRPPRGVVIPAGTVLHVRLSQAVSAATAKVGDSFQITLDQPLVLPGGLVVAAGYPGTGEVTLVERRHGEHRPAQLGVSLDEMVIGHTRLRLCAEPGLNNLGWLIVAPAENASTSADDDAALAEGQALLAYVAQDAVLGVPLAPPPSAD